MFCVSSAVMPHSQSVCVSGVRVSLLELNPLNSQVCSCKTRDKFKPSMSYVVLSLRVTFGSVATITDEDCLTFREK